MAHIRKVLILLALYAVAVTFAQVSQGGPHTNQGGSPVSQGGPHENQGRARRQAQSFDDEEGSEKSAADWTTCDFTIVPKISCHDCHTKMICKQIGGILKACTNPFRPHCNNGVCSAIPSAECV